MNSLLSVHAAATWALVGLIWTVQLVHYPLFAQVGADTFRAYHARHTRLITWIVAPLMAVELGTAALLVVLGARESWLLGSLVPLSFIWLATWRVQIPLHDKLSAGFDAQAHRRLVASNWWRTAAWSIRGACVLYGLW
jgi:hypothetical protein